MGTSYGLVRSVAPAAEAAAPGTVTELWLYYWQLGSPSVFRAYSYTVDGGGMSLVEQITAPSGGTSSPDDWGAQGAFDHHSLGQDGEIAVMNAPDPNRFVWRPGSGLIYGESSSSAPRRTPLVWVNGRWHYIFRSTSLGWKLFRRSADLTSSEAVSDYAAALAGTEQRLESGSDGNLFYAWTYPATSDVWAFAFETGPPAVLGSQVVPRCVCDPADSGVMWDNHITADGSRQVGRTRDPLTPALVDRFPDETPWKLYGTTGTPHRIRHHYHTGHVLAYGCPVSAATSLRLLLHNNVTAEAGETPLVAVFDAPTDPSGSGNPPWAAAIKTVAS
jgi:hypothetical protein